MLMKPAFLLSERFLVLLPCLSYFSATSRSLDQLWFPTEKLSCFVCTAENRILFCCTNVQFAKSCMLSLSSGKGWSTACNDVAQPSLSWLWLFGWQAGKKFIWLQESVSLLYRGGSLKAWSGPQPPILLNFLALASWLLQQCTGYRTVHFFIHWEWEKTTANINPKRLKLWLLTKLQCHVNSRNQICSSGWEKRQ